MPGVHLTLDLLLRWFLPDWLNASLVLTAPATDLSGLVSRQTYAPAMIEMSVLLFIK